jgi:hypothetical protein
MESKKIFRVNVQQGKKEHDTYLEYRTMEKLGGKIQFMK